MNSKSTIPEELYEGLKNVKWNKEKVQYFFDYNKLNRIVVDLVSVPVGNDNRKTLKVIYNCGNCGNDNIEQCLRDIVNMNRNCPKCSMISRSISRKGRKQKSYPRVKNNEDAQQLFDKVAPGLWKDAKIVGYRCNKLQISAICTGCGEKSIKYIDNLNQNRHLGCFNCKSKTGQTIVELCNKIHENTIECVVNLEKRYLSMEKFTTRCKICGMENEKNYIHNLITKQRGCKSCKSSKGEKFILELLTKQFGLSKNKDFIIQAYDERICYNEGFVNYYDFYIKPLNLFIEVDGSGHRKFVKFSENAKSLEEVQKIDKYKDEKALELGYNLIRLIYNDDKEVKVWKRELELQLFEDLEICNLRIK